MNILVPILNCATYIITSCLFVSSTTSKQTFIYLHVLLFSNPWKTIFLSFSSLTNSSYRGRWLQVSRLRGQQGPGRQVPAPPSLRHAGLWPLHRVCGGSAPPGGLRRLHCLQSRHPDLRRPRICTQVVSSDLSKYQKEISAVCTRTSYFDCSCYGNLQLWREEIPIATLKIWHQNSQIHHSDLMPLSNWLPPGSEERSARGVSPCIRLNW